MIIQTNLALCQNSNPPPLNLTSHLAVSPLATTTAVKHFAEASGFCSLYRCGEIWPTLCRVALTQVVLRSFQALKLQHTTFRNSFSKYVRKKPMSLCHVR